MSPEQITREALALPEEDRAWLANQLLDSLTSIPADNTSISASWLKEANKRLHELRSGLVQGIPAEVVMAKLRKKYQRGTRHPVDRPTPAVNPENPVNPV